MNFKAASAYAKALPPTASKGCEQHYYHRTSLDLSASAASSYRWACSSHEHCGQQLTDRMLLQSV